MYKRILEFVAIAALLTGSPSVAAGQGLPQSLYLVAAATAKYGAATYAGATYRVEPQQQRLVLLRTLSTKKKGVDFVRPDYEGRKILIATPKLEPVEVEVIDMAAPTKVSRIPFNISSVPDLGRLLMPWSASVAAMRHEAGIRMPDGWFSFTKKFVLNRPGMGNWLALQAAYDSGQVMVGVALDGSGRREALPSDSLFNIRLHGEFGLADLGDSDFQFATIRDKKVFLTIGGRQIDLSLPDFNVPVKDSDVWFLIAHDGATSVLRRLKDSSASHDGEGASPIYVRKRNADSWTTFRIPGATPSVKMIGSWIMGTAASDALGRESPGASGRRKLRFEGNKPIEEDRPATDSWFAQSDKYFPGILFLIDSVTGHNFQIRTGQGDSEILLVEGESVYYRVNNKIFVAAIDGLTIGPAKLLVQDDAVADVHWAFMAQ